MVVSRAGEEAEDILAFLLGVFQERNSGEVREDDLVSQLVFLLVSIYGKRIGSQDEIYGFPSLDISSVNYSHNNSRAPTLVFLVLFSTNPLFKTRSNSKLPFWLTGEKVSRLRCEARIRLADVGGGSVTVEGGGIWRGVRSGIARGWVVCCIPALYICAMVMPKNVGGGRTSQRG